MRAKSPPVEQTQSEQERRGRGWRESRVGWEGESETVEEEGVVVGRKTDRNKEKKRQQKEKEEKEGQKNFSDKMGKKFFLL